MHGVFLDVFNFGVLLTGVSGIGKSEVALSLIDRGHKIIADDCVQLTRLDNQTIVGNCPQLLQDFLEVRGLGVLNIRKMYGDDAILPSKTLNLLINLFSIGKDDLRNIDRLYGMYREKNILDITYTEVSMPVAPGRNLSILIEAAVANLQLRGTGYDSSSDFNDRQQKQIDEGVT